MVVKAETDPGGYDWTQGHSYANLRAGEPGLRSDLRSRSIVVDGVSYTVGDVRRLIGERHRLASENTRLRRRLEQNANHLRWRTNALCRLIAAKGPRLS